MSQPILSVLSKDRDLVLCGEAGLGGLLKVELLEAVEWRGESESWRKEGRVGEIRRSLPQSKLGRVQQMKLRLCLLLTATDDECLLHMHCSLICFL